MSYFFDSLIYIFQYFVKLGINQYVVLIFIEVITVLSIFVILGLCFGFKNFFKKNNKKQNKQLLLLIIGGNLVLFASLWYFTKLLDY